MDVIIVRDGKIAALYVFLEPSRHSRGARDGYKAHPYESHPHVISQFPPKRIPQ